MLNTRKRKGFTLVEVIVVLVVLAILAAIIVPAMAKWIDKAKEKQHLLECRACVLAAQTLVTEEYGKSGQGVYPQDEDVRALAGITDGTTSGIRVGGSVSTADPTIPIVACLSYTASDGQIVTYLRYPEPHYVFGLGTEWALGQTYNVGDTMTTNGYIFRCIRAHTTGTTSRTRNPSLRSNKSTWDVIGYTGEPLQYSSTVRYAEGAKVVYKGKLYERTTFNMVGGQVPYEERSSEYWILLGPAT